MKVLELARIGSFIAFEKVLLFRLHLSQGIRDVLDIKNDVFNILPRVRIISPVGAKRQSFDGFARDKFLSLIIRCTQELVCPRLKT